MKVLVVDDSATIRTILRRALVEIGADEIVEAANGIEALAEVARHRFQLVILDVNMPVMDGVETLEAIRGSQSCAGLPVLMLTGERNEVVVRRLVELGITDFLSKPLGKQQMSERLARVLGKLRERARNEPVACAAGSALRVLVVDRDADLRHFLVTTLGSHFRVAEADSGAAALQLLLEPTEDGIDIVLAGSHVEPPSLVAFVTKVKSLRNASLTRLIAVLPRNESKSAQLTDVIDGVIDRTYVPELFLAQLQRLIGEAETPFRKLLLLQPSLQRDTVAATEQVFGMMVSSEVELCDSNERAEAAPAGDMIHASIGLEADDDELGLSLSLRTDIGSARIIAALMIGVTPFDVHDDDVRSSVAEIVNIIAGRLRNRLVDTSMKAQIGIPKVAVGEPPADQPVEPAHDTIFLGFRSPAHQFSLEITVCGRAAA
jgi:two-component system chemotaxis response regulator CheY